MGADMTQAALSACTKNEVSQRTISRALNCESAIGIDNLAALAGVFKLSPMELLDPDLIERLDAGHKLPLLAQLYAEVPHLDEIARLDLMAQLATIKSSQERRCGGKLRSADRKNAKRMSR